MGSAKVPAWVWTGAASIPVVTRTAAAKDTETRRNRAVRPTTIPPFTSLDYEQ